MTDIVFSGQNVACKYFLRDRIQAEHICRSIGAEYLGIATQVDTYYEHGGKVWIRRLTIDSPPQWIHASRTDVQGVQLLTCEVALENSADRLRIPRQRVIALVIKDRSLWMYQNVRIHLDKVREVGDVFELETTVDHWNGDDKCAQRIKCLSGRFKDVLGEQISIGNLELVLQKRTQGATATLCNP